MSVTGYLKSLPSVYKQKFDCFIFLLVLIFSDFTKTWAFIWSRIFLFLILSTNWQDLEYFSFFFGFRFDFSISCLFIFHSHLSCGSWKSIIIIHKRTEENLIKVGESKGDYDRNISNYSGEANLIYNLKFLIKIPEDMADLSRSA